MADVGRGCLIWMPLTSNEVQEMDEYDEEFDVEDMLRMMFPEDDGEPDDGFSIDCMPWDND